MKVSVIIPFYNSATLLTRTIDSIIAQTYTNIEVIMVDDGSTDDSYSIASKYINHYITVLKQCNAGASNARNKGLLYSKGDFIQFLDAGDVIDPNKIAVQLEALQKNPEKLAVCKYKQFNVQDEITKSDYPDQSSFIYSCDNPQEFLINLWGGYGKMNFIQTNCWLVPRKIIEKIGCWRAYRCPDDDGEFFARVILASKGIVYTPGVYNFYHIDESGKNQLSRTKNHKYLMNSLLTIDLKYGYLQKYGHHNLLNRAIAAQYYRFAVDMYPLRKNLSTIAWKRFCSLGEDPPELLLGGRMIQLVYNLFGWRIARLLRFYFRES